MELVAVEEPPPPKEPEPLPPDVSSEALAKEEEIDVALEEIIEEPEPEPIEADAQVTQEASAHEEAVDPNALVEWVQLQIEREKYYPPSAKRAGYQGIFDLMVVVEEDGTISDASIIYGRGHPLLRRALEKMLGKIIGHKFAQPLGQTVEVDVEFEFELQ